MYKVYKYIYYRIYSWQLNAWGEKEKPHDSAMLLITLLSFINVCTLLAILQGITGIDFTQIGAWPVGYLIIMAICYMAIHHYIIYGNQRYKRIIAEYSQKSKDYHEHYTIWVVAYLVGTPILLVLSGLLVNFLR